jgi:DNA-binding NarL/FixJ family response regulator
VAGDVAVYRDLIAERLGGRGVTIDSVGDAELVVLCPNGQGLSAVASLASAPTRKVVVLGVAEDEALSYFEAGALCALPPDASADEVCDAVQRAGHGQTTLSEGQTTLIFHRIRETRSSARHEALACLTPREREVARLLAKDLQNKEIASRLVVSVATVKKHVNRILFKLGVSSRHKAAARLRLMQGF